MDAMKLLAENLPVAVALIVVTKLFLVYLKGRDDSMTDALNKNTEVLAELKTVISGMEHVMRDCTTKKRGG